MKKHSELKPRKTHAEDMVISDVRPVVDWPKNVANA